MKIGMVSLGCPKNLTDSETMLALLAQHGHEIVNDPAEAEIIVVNTCGFIDSAKQESIDTLLEMARFKEDGACKKLICCGCLAERYHDEIKAELPEVDAIVGAGDFVRICEVIDECARGEFVCLFGSQNRPLPENMPRMLATPSYTAYLKIADGCDNNCTYCAIPMIRGHYRSRKIKDIVAEAQTLADGGARELIIIAQDTTRYGTDLYGERRLCELLDELCKIDGIHWLRLHYLYPEAIDDRLIDTIAAQGKICNYFDMPIQHINNEILRKMARRTNRAQIEEKIRKIREKIPDAVIRTSLIAGFPTEDEAAHREMREFLTAARLDRVGVFAYSAEEGTAAAKFEPQVDEEIRAQRADELMQLQQKISLEKNTAKCGGILEVLCEGYDEENYMYYGRSYADSIGIDSRVYFAAPDEVREGEFVRVKILNADEYDLTGEMISED